MEQGMYTFSLHLCFVLALSLPPPFPPSLLLLYYPSLSSPHFVPFSLCFYHFAKPVANSPQSAFKIAAVGHCTLLYMPPLAPRLPLHRLAHCRFAPRIRRALPSCTSAPHIPRICHVDLCRARPPCMATTPAEGPQIRVNPLHVRLARSAHTVPTIHVPTLPWASARINISPRIICACHMAHIVRHVPSIHTTLRRRTHLQSMLLAPRTARALPVLPPCSFASHLLQPTLRRMRDHLRGLRELRSCALTVPAPSPTFLHARLYVRLVQPQPRPVVPTPTDGNEFRTRHIPTSPCAHPPTFHIRCIVKPPSASTLIREHRIAEVDVCEEDDLRWARLSAAMDATYDFSRLG
ncbi:hypothetical protein B0H16DRAFT_1777425 [Mycena metata]|uniref:Uncharacterized protein n=1 Tax=Mycena metata TaxID=1033252 RepID=A0AAD7HUM4_9AGAR|nr:hypothetical protein B0H16DRAFT_1777425 [Mycena metata]